MERLSGRIGGDVAGESFCENDCRRVLYTKHQSGAFHYFATPAIDHSFTGADNYYNNSQYAGWEHWGQGIGNPLVTSPIYNKDGNLAFESNRVKGFHIG